MKENKIVNQEKMKNRISFRSAGSHSPIDVVSIDKERKIIRLIQCKPDSMSEAAKARLIAEHPELIGKFEITFEVI